MTPMEIKRTSATDINVKKKLINQQPDVAKPQIVGSPDCLQGPDRFSSCGGTIANYVINQIDSNGTVTPIGGVNLEVYTGVGWDSASLNWLLKSTVKVTNTWGTELVGPTAAMASGCDIAPTECKSTSGPSSETVHLFNGASYTKTVTQQATGGPAQFPNATLGLGGVLGMVLNITPIKTPDKKVFIEDGEYNGTQGRCENIVVSTAGCINPEEYSFVVYDSTRYPLVTEVAQHVYDSQQRGVLGLPSKWGRPGVGNLVSRTTSKAVIDANRAVACPVSPPDPLLECDEFSLAATYEGASRVAPGDWSARTVPAKSNSSQGGLTGFYFGSYRVSDGDYFYILAILPDGRDSWAS
jgi:hypothetical protein